MSSRTGADVYAYTKILKYRNKSTGVSIVDIFLLILSAIIYISVNFYITSYIQQSYSTLMFVIFILYLLLLIVAFTDFAAGLGIFKDKGVFSSTLILLLSIIISSVFTFIADNMFTEKDPETMALIELANLIFITIIISYFLMTSTPNRQGSEQMIKNLTEIKEEVTKLSIAELGVREAYDRSLKWLQFQQTQERIWGEEDPLYETSEIMRVFFDIGKNLNYSWKDIKKGEEDIHKLEQTYYLLLENIERVAIEPDIGILSALITLGMVNHENITTSGPTSEPAEKQLFRKTLNALYEQFEEELKTSSEWDFVSELEKLEDRFSIRESLPPLLYFTRIFHLINKKDTYFKCGEILGDTFNILINRSDSRFSNIEQKEISNYILGLMYNTLITVIKPPVYIGEEVNLMIEEEEEEEEDFDMDLPGMSLPGFDDFDFNEIGMDDVGGVDSEKMKINVSLAQIRNLLRKKQEIDGSWSGRIDTTCECLLAVMDKESAENDFVKLGTHYLLALQDKNGSWQNDPLLTAKAIKTLKRVNDAISGF
ncbi:MAG: hypothetical protein INQ03_05560 [Candidatus Heimdallarchaeota archaeon]|nr:hypothetical protein [Candidatus Heimdallarchaeota archaeon]